MTKLGDVKTGERALVRNVGGDARFVTRITSVGLTENCPVEIVQNARKRPVLIYSRDSLIAIDRNDSQLIDVEVL